MAKLSVLGEVVCTALCMSVILWQGSEGCYKITCPPGKHCAETVESGPVCVCDERCPKIYSPVCGSDGKTYNNVCELQVAACKNNTSITVVHKGICNSCKQINCPSGKYCTVTDESGPVCVCNDMCTMIYAPVCGSDGKTYGNECELRVAACKSNTYITIIRDGACDKSSSCDGITCPPGKSCTRDDAGQSKCTCNTICPDIYEPVCGSDGKTYGSECRLHVKACETETYIRVDHKGEC